MHVLYICIYIDTHLKIHAYTCLHIYVCTCVYIHTYKQIFSGPVMQLRTYSLKRSPINLINLFKNQWKGSASIIPRYLASDILWCYVMLCYVNLLSISVKDFVIIYHLSFPTLWAKEMALIITAWICFRLSFFWGTQKILRKFCNTFKTILRLKISYWLMEGIGNFLLFPVDWIRRLTMVSTASRLGQ